jgi:hypothetical protein
VKPTSPGRGIDWDEANNEFFGYIGLLNNGHLDLEEDERVPCLKSSLTRLENLLGKAVLEAPESHKLNGQEIRIAGFLLRTLWVQYYGILDSHRILDTERKVHLVVCSVLYETSRASETTRRYLLG